MKAFLVERTTKAEKKQKHFLHLCPAIESFSFSCAKEFSVSIALHNIWA